MSPKVDTGRLRNGPPLRASWLESPRSQASRVVQRLSTVPFAWVSSAAFCAALRLLVQLVNVRPLLPSKVKILRELAAGIRLAAFQAAEPMLPSP